jgi:periplasmic protein CpxP/Spy
MKRQMIALVAGAVLIAAPLMTNMAAAQNGEGRPGPRMERLAKKLNLTDTQKTQLDEIRARTATKIRAILTPAQQAQLDTAKAERQKRNEANGGRRPEGAEMGPQGLLKSLNLTDSQKSQVKEIRAAAQGEMDGVLTTSQKAQLEQIKKQLQGRRGQRQAR